MPHDPGSSRHVDKQMKMAGLGRLRWYCTPCAKQCRDANAFKQHTMSESHVRHMEGINDLGGTIKEFSQQFQSAFLQFLRTGHQEKAIHINKFYQTYIADRHHVHLNATRWNSLTEFAKHLGREALCRVEEKDDGLYISWIDRSPEALRRADTLRKQEWQDAASQRMDEKILKAQIERAQATKKGEDSTAPPPPPPVEPGKVAAFQFTNTRKDPPASSTAGPVKKFNAFKAAKRNPLQDSKKRKRSESTSAAEVQATGS